MYRAGVVDATGRFSKETHSPRLRQGPNGLEFVLAWANQTSIGRDITFNVNDMRALQLAKSAMYSAAKILMRRLGVTKLDKVVLAGAFGSFIDKVKAMAMGLYPDCELHNVFAVGNAAGDGARIALLNVDKRAEADAIARQIEYVELTVEPDFEKQFAAAMHFPHMSDSFPHLQKMLDKATRERAQRLLRTNPLFADLPSDVIRRLAAVTEEVRFKKNQAIFAAGGIADALYILKEGSVTLTYSPDGDSPQTTEVKEGGALNGEAVVQGRPHIATAKAAALNTKLLAIPAAEMRKVIEEAPEIRGRFVRAQ
ncbi:MAG: DUF4445 domain-containing protein, partial [Chloroflexi bacterium]|nr:DUF4445 domain-containing protein [Chloroflexota bacterium]